MCDNGRGGDRILLMDIGIYAMTACLNYYQYYSWQHRDTCRRSPSYYMGTVRYTSEHIEVAAVDSRTVCLYKHKCISVYCARNRGEVRFA